MASLRSKFWRSMLRRMFKLQGLSILAERARTLKNSKFHPPFPKSLRVERLDIDGMASAMINPAKAAGPSVVLHLHGGGYVTGSIAASLMMCIPMARVLNMKMLLPEYRLAPEHPFPAALDDALKAYRWLLAQGYEHSDIILSGDSAGGGLCLATAAALRDSGDSLPAAIVCLSPWADLTNSSDSHAANAESEVILKTYMLKQWAGYYAGDAGVGHPSVSPVFADYTGFPPLLIMVGRDEILLDDSLRVAERAKAAGADVTLKVFEGLWHVWPALGDLIPESREAFEEIGRFIEAKARL